MKCDRKQILSIDGRIRVLVVMVSAVLAVVLRENELLLLLTGLIVCIMALSGAAKTALIQLCMILSVCALQSICMILVQGSIRTFILTVLQLLPRLLLIRMLGLSLTRTMSTGEIIETLEKLKIPRMLIIPFAVTLRYLPTVKAELGFIRESLKLRGIDTSFPAFVKSPVKWMEYMLVPVLMRSLRLADELSAAAMVRGIENHTARAWLYPREYHAEKSLVLHLHGRRNQVTQEHHRTRGLPYKRSIYMKKERNMS
ncbi:MAG: energy-coupling factor transporter transmembrane component T [bacterium]|nr:energy-coupling factor transporter transmembrane component T [bacterium]